MKRCQAKNKSFPCTQYYYIGFHSLNTDMGRSIGRLWWHQSKAATVLIVSTLFSRPHETILSPIWARQVDPSVKELEGILVVSCFCAASLLWNSPVLFLGLFDEPGCVVLPPCQAMQKHDAEIALWARSRPEAQQARRKSVPPETRRGRVDATHRRHRPQLIPLLLCCFWW